MVTELVSYLFFFDDIVFFFFVFFLTDYINNCCFMLYFVFRSSRGFFSAFLLVSLFCHYSRKTNKQKERYNHLALFQVVCCNALHRANCYGARPHCLASGKVIIVQFLRQPDEDGVFRCQGSKTCRGYFSFCILFVFARLAVYLLLSFSLLHATALSLVLAMPHPLSVLFFFFPSFSFGSTQQGLLTCRSKRESKKKKATGFKGKRRFGFLQRRCRYQSPSTPLPLAHLPRMQSKVKTWLVNRAHQPPRWTRFVRYYSTSERTTRRHCIRHRPRCCVANCNLGGAAQRCQRSRERSCGC